MPGPEPTAKPVSFLDGSWPFILHYLRRRPWHFLSLLLLVSTGAGAAVAGQYSMKLLVDALTGSPHHQAPVDQSGVWIALGLFVACIAVESVVLRLSGWLGCRTTVGIGVDVRLDLFDYLGGQPIRYFTENLAGALGQRITATAGNLGALINLMVWRIVPPCIDFLGALIIFATIDWRMMVVLGIFVILVTAGLILFGERGRPTHQAYARQGGIVAGALTDTITNMWAVKAFSARRREWQRLEDGFRGEAAAQRASWMYTERARVVHDVLLWLMAAGALTWSIHLWSQGRATAGDVVLVSALTFRILHGSREMALALVDVAQQVGYIDDTLHIIGQPPDVCDIPAAPALMPFGGSLSFRGVSFDYGHGRNALTHLDLEIPAGQKIGIVGPSGAGKSTLIALMQRLYDPQSGDVLIDGQPIARVAQDSLRAALAVVPQEIILFHRSVMENIRFARPEASDDEVYAAARAACCDGFIRLLPQGYHTIVGERGTKLSGGQRQRIGIARAFLKTAQIIILDEATSALDTESEMEIHRALVQLMHNRTVIAVAHRLSTLTSFDRILVVKDGRIVEDGPVRSLRGQNGPFDHMWRLQAAGLPLDEDEIAEAEV